MRAFSWYQNRWPWMTWNGMMAVILRYFTDYRSTGDNFQFCQSGWSQTRTVWLKNGANKSSFRQFYSVMYAVIFRDYWKTVRKARISRKLHDKLETVWDSGYVSTVHLLLGVAYATLRGQLSNSWALALRGKCEKSEKIRFVGNGDIQSLSLRVTQL